MSVAYERTLDVIKECTLASGVDNEGNDERDKSDTDAFDCRAS